VNPIYLEADVLEIVTLWQLKKIFPSMEVSALVNYSAPSDFVILPTLSGLIESIALL
jgi:hypothetical protein